MPTLRIGLRKVHGINGKQFIVIGGVSYTILPGDGRSGFSKVRK